MTAEFVGRVTIIVNSLPVLVHVGKDDIIALLLREGDAVGKRLFVVGILAGNCREDRKSSSVLLESALEGVFD